MSRVVHYAIYRISDSDIKHVMELGRKLASSRQWKSDPFWLAYEGSSSLFERLYFQELCAHEKEQPKAAGFIRLQGDECDFLAVLLFMRDISTIFNARVIIHDNAHPIARLRHVVIDNGKLESGEDVESLLSRRPFNKRVGNSVVVFYPPGYMAHSNSFPQVGWRYAVGSIRAGANTFFEAEKEALKILNGFTHLGD
jgi:hypothetical protein